MKGDDGGGESGGEVGFQVDIVWKFFFLFRAGQLTSTKEQKKRNKHEVTF